MTIQEASQSLGVSERTIRRWIKSGRLKARKQGGRVRILLAESVESSSKPPEKRTTDVRSDVRTDDHLQDIIRIKDEQIEELRKDKQRLEKRVDRLDTRLEEMEKRTNFLISQIPLLASPQADIVEADSVDITKKATTPLKKKPKRKPKGKPKKSKQRQERKSLFSRLFR